MKSGLKRSRLVKTTGSIAMRSAQTTGRLTTGINARNNKREYTNLHSAPPRSGIQGRVCVPFPIDLLQARNDFGGGNFFGKRSEAHVKLGTEWQWSREANYFALRQSVRKDVYFRGCAD